MCHFTDCEGQGNEILGKICASSVGPSIEMDNNISNGEAFLNQVSEPPPLCHLDKEVLESLPPEIFSELNDIYSGKLIDLITKSKGKSENISSSSSNSHVQVEGENSFLFSYTQMPTSQCSANCELLKGHSEFV